MSNFFLDGDFRFSQSVTFSPLAAAPIGSYWTSAATNPANGRGTYAGQTYSSKGWLAVGPAIPDSAILGVAAVSLTSQVDNPVGNYGAIISTKIPNGNRFFSGSVLRVSFWCYTNSRHVGLRLHRNFGTSSTTAEQLIDIRAGQDNPVGVWEHIVRDFPIPARLSTDDFRPDDYLLLDVVVDNIGAGLPYLNQTVPFAEATGAATPIIAVTGFYADVANTQTPAFPIIYSPAPVSDAGQLTGSVGGSGFTVAGTGLTASGGGTTIGLTTPVTAANGGTGVTTALAEKNRVGIFSLSSNNPIGGSDVPGQVNQIGISVNGFLYQANGTSAGNWTTVGLVVPGGIGTIGDPSLGKASLGGNTFWYMNGAPAQQISSNTGDANLILVDTNPYGSGSGLSIGYVGKTNTGASIHWTNSASEYIELHDQFRGSFNVCPENGSAANNPGVVTVLTNGPHPMALANTFAPTGTTANYPWYFMDGRSSPYKSYFSKFVDTKVDPTVGGWISTMIIDHTAGNVTIPGLLLMGSGASQITTTAGKINIGSFDSAQAGTLNISAGTLQASRVVTTNPTTSGFMKTAGVSPISLDVGQNATGLSNDVTAVAGTPCLTFVFGGNVTHAETGGAGQSWFGGGQTTPSFAIGNSADLTNFNNWGACTFDVHGSTGSDIKTKTTNYTLTIDDSVILLNGTTLTATLPDATFHCKNRIYTIKLIAATTTATVATTSSQNIDGATTSTLSTQYSFITVQSNGTQWYIVAKG